MMRTRPRGPIILSGASLLCLGLTLAAAVASLLGLSPREHRLSLARDFHVSLDEGFSNDLLIGRVVFFNNAEDGPYRGSIITFGDGNGNESPRMIEKRHLGDAWGVYYRYFRTADWTLWTLMVSLWYPLVVFSLLSLLSLVWIIGAARRPNEAGKGVQTVSGR